MFRNALWISTAVIAGFIAASQTASAQDFGYGNSHGSFHQDLNHNQFHQQQYHSNQHQFPQTYYQHNQLHQDLNHDRYHNSLSHDSYHSYQPQHGYQSNYYGRSGFNGGVLRRGLSPRFGF